MSSRPEWDAFLLDTGGDTASGDTSWSWELRWQPWSRWSLPSLPAGTAFVAATVLAPVLVWRALVYLQHRAENTLKTMRRFLTAAKGRMIDMHYDPQFRQCLRALRRNEKEFAELLKACDRVPGQHACRGVCKQALVCGSGDVGAGALTEPSDSDCTLTLSDGADTDACCGGASPTDAEDDLIRAARQRIAGEQGNWYAHAAHGMCLQSVEDSSEDDADADAALTTSLRDARDEQLWRQVYAEERRRKRPR